MEKEDQRSVIKYFWTRGWGAKRIHQKVISTFGDSAYGLSQIKI
jgi:hypothetical protein